MVNESVRILVVDDELPICELLSEFLTLQGYDVTTANSGEDALSRFREGRPHLVLLDIRMPGMSGLEVLGRIRDMDRDAGVIMLSAFGDASTIQEALQVGADYYMEKPMELDRLLKLLESWKQTALK